MFFCERNPDFVWKVEDLLEVESKIKREEKYFFFTLKEKLELECLRIFFDSEISNEYLEKITLEFEKEGEWEKIDKKAFLGDKAGEAIIPLNEEYLTNRFRISCVNMDKINKVEGFKRKYRGLLVAARGDAFGARMHAFITAIYLSQKTGFKFGYIWNIIDNQNGLAIEGDNKFFEEWFIKKYAYTGKCKFTDIKLPVGSIQEIKDKSHQNAWGYYITNAHVLNKIFLKDLDEKEYLENFGKTLRNLPFKEKYKQVIKASDKKAEDIGEFVAIHLRGGDIIYSERLNDIISEIFKRIFPIETVVYAIKHFIEKENKKVVLFGLDIKANLAIKEYLNNYALDNKFFIAQEFQNNFNMMQALLYDIFLMSRAAIIVGNYSAYSQFAVALGNAEFKNFNQFFSAKEIFDSIQYYFDRIDAHPAQKAASCAYTLGLICNKLNTDIATKISWVNRGLSYDCDNSMFRVVMLEILMKENQIERVDKCLENILIQYKEGFLGTLLKVKWGVSLYMSMFSTYLSHSSPSYPYISYIAARISLFQKNPTNALKFIQYSLQSQPNNEEFLSCKKEIVSLLPKEEFAKAEVKKTPPKPEPAPQELEINSLKATQDSLSSLPIKKQTLEIKNLESDLKIKELKAKQIEKELGYSYNVLEELDLKKQELIKVKQQLDSKTKELESKNTGLESNLNYPIFKGNLSYLNAMTSAKDRIHNHLSYKLGKAMIENSKSILGYIRMPYVLSYIKEQHNKEQKQYQEQIKKNPNLKLPKLESYKDYKEALKEKECFTYKLGEAFIRANTLKSKNNINNNTNNISGGGGQILSKPQYLSTLQSILYKPIAYFKFAKEVRELNRELAKKEKAKEERGIM